MILSVDLECFRINMYSSTSLNTKTNSCTRKDCFMHGCEESGKNIEPVIVSIDGIAVIWHAHTSTHTDTRTHTDINFMLSSTPRILTPYPSLGGIPIG